MTASPSVKDLLDDVAHRATDGRPVQVAPALARAALRGRAARRRRVAGGLAAAAVVALVAVLLPWAGIGPSPVPPALGPVGLPDHYFTPPVWTPTVLDAPIEAASLLLDSPVRPSAPDLGGPLMLYTGAVLVSADGRDYRRIPWYAGTTAATLSDDGRRVAWGDGEVAPAVAGKIVVHRLRLGQSRPEDFELGGAGWGGYVTRLVWERDGSLLVAAELFQQANSGQSQPTVWRINSANRLDLLCSCAEAGFGVGPDGTLWQWGPGAALVPGARRLPGSTDLLPGAGVLFSPDGTAWAVPAAQTGSESTPGTLLVHTFSSSAVARLALSAGLGTSDPQVISWTPRGLVLSTQTRSGVLSLLDPKTLTARTLATGDRGNDVGAASVVAVSAPALAAGPIPGVAPEFPWWQRERVEDALVRRGYLPLRLNPVTAVLGITVLLGGFALLRGPVRRARAVYLGLLPIGRGRQR